MFGHLHPIMFFDTLMNSVSDWVCDHAISLFTVWNRRQDRVLTRLLHCPFLSVYQGGTPAVHFDGLADFPPNCLLSQVRVSFLFFFSSPLSISPKGADFDIVLHWSFHFPAEYKENLELNILKHCNILFPFPVNVVGICIFKQWFHYQQNQFQISPDVRIRLYGRQKQCVHLPVCYSLKTKRREGYIISGIRLP